VLFSVGLGGTLGGNVGGGAGSPDSTFEGAFGGRIEGGKIRRQNPDQPFKKGTMKSIVGGKKSARKTWQKKKWQGPSDRGDRMPTKNQGGEPGC